MGFINEVVYPNRFFAKAVYKGSSFLQLQFFCFFLFVIRLLNIIKIKVAYKKEISLTINY